MPGDTNTLADALQDGGQPALIDCKSKHTVSAAHLKQLVFQTAASLRTSGLQPGDTVCQGLAVLSHWAASCKHGLISGA